MRAGAVEPDHPTDDDLRRRMGTYVRTLLPGHPDLQGIDWPLAIGWDARCIWATLTRGELVLRTEQRGVWHVNPWWLPQKKRRAQDLVKWLARGVSWYYRRGLDAVDETGRLRLPAWRAPDGGILWQETKGWERVEVVLEPGTYPGTSNGGGDSRVTKIGEHITLVPEKALEEGWMRVIRRGGPGDDVS